MSARRLIPLVLTAIAVACGGDASTDDPATRPPAPPPDFALPAMDFAAIANERITREVSEAQLQRGNQCGWRAGWMGIVREARYDTPSEFRSRAVGRAFKWGSILLLIGLAGTLVLAWVLPRLRRREKGSKKKKTAAPSKTWAAYFKSLVVRFFKRLGRALRVEQFDPTLASERQRMVETCRDAERQLSVALALVPAPAPALAQAPSPASYRSDPEGSPRLPAADERRPSGPAATRGSDLPAKDPAPAQAPTSAQAPAPSHAKAPTPAKEPAPAPAKAIETWRSEITALRRRLEGPASLSPELSPDHVAPRLDVVHRATRDLRLAVERAHINAATDDELIELVDRELADRPETPRDRATDGAELAPWVRTVGFAGVGALAVALPMLACWMAAGAFPLFFALLFGLAGLGAIIVARAHLHRAGRLPLLPGFADRVASWLTAVLTVTLLVTMVSSWMSADGGLDLGDPPPVAMPDPQLLQAPELFAGKPTRTQAVPAPKPPPSQP